MTRPQQHLREVVNNVGEPDGTPIIMPLIEEGLRNLQKTERDRRIAERGTDKKLNPHMTDAGKCPRKTVLSLMNVEETNPLDTDSLLRFLFGHSAEEALAKLFEAYQGATYLREERVEITAGDTKITGRKDFDAVRVLWGDSVVELKQTNGFALGYLLKRGKPNEDHVHQLNLYLCATGKQRGLLVYAVAGQRKGEPMLESWIVNYDPQMAEDDIKALADADARAKAGTTPPIPQGYERNKFPCSYCGYKDFCFGNVSAALAASVATA